MSDMMKFFKAYVFALGLILLPIFSQGAVNCAPQGKALSQLTSSDLYLAADSLYKSIFTNTTAEPQDWVLCTKNLSEQAQHLSLQFKALAPSLSNTQGADYLTTLMVADSLLLSLRVKAGIPLSEIKVKLQTQDFLRFFPYSIAGIPGTSGKTVGPETTLWLNGESHFSAHLNAMARIRSQNQSEQYFEVSRCLLSRLFIEKSEAYAQLSGEQTSLNLNGLTSCQGLELKRLLDSQIGVEYDKRFFQLQSALESSFSYLTENDKDQLRSYVENSNIEVQSLLINSVLDAGFDSDLSAINKTFSQIENQLQNNNAIVSDLVSTGQSLKNQIRMAIKQLNISTDLSNFNNLYRRLVLVNLQNDLPLSNAVALTTSQASFEDNLTEALVGLSSRAIEQSLTAELVLNGQAEAVDIEQLTNKLRPQIVNSLRQGFINKKTSKELISKLEAPTKPKLLETNPDLIKYAKDLHRITDPNTNFQDLEYNAVAIARLFDNAIGQLPADFRIYVDQILTRKTFDDRAKTWTRAKDFLSKDQATRNYQCIEPGKIAFGLTVLKGMFGKAPSENYSRKQSCAFVMQLADYLGLNLSSEPTKMADVWWPFEKYLSKSEREDRMLQYRENLKHHYADNNRILDFPLNKLGIKSDQKLYDVIATSNNSEETNGLVDGALKYIRSYDEMEALKILNSNSIEDLKPYIVHSNTLDELLGATAIHNYRPDVSAANSAETSQAFPGLYQYHTKYKGNLIRHQQLDQALNKKMISDLTMPILYLGGAWIVRGITLRTTGLRAIGLGLQAASASTQVLTQGYSHLLTWIFAGGFVESYFWSRDIKQAQAEVEALKLGDALIQQGEISLIDYGQYLYLKNGLKYDQSQARTGMIRDGLFTAMGPVLNMIEPLIMSRSLIRAPLNTSAANNIQKSKSWFDRFSARGARLDKLRMRPNLKMLKSNGRLDLFSLQAARTRMAGNANAEEAYNRIIFTLGQRSNQALNNSERAKLVAKELFGSESAVSELHQLATEYNRLFPELIRGGL